MRFIQIQNHLINTNSIYLISRSIETQIRDGKEVTIYQLNVYTHRGSSQGVPLTYDYVNEEELEEEFAHLRDILNKDF